MSSLSKITEEFYSQDIRLRNFFGLVNRIKYVTNTIAFALLPKVLISFLLLLQTSLLPLSSFFLLQNLSLKQFTVFFFSTSKDAPNFAVTAKGPKVQHVSMEIKRNEPAPVVPMAVSLAGGAV